MKHRLCLSAVDAGAATEGALIELGSDQAHYLQRVLRLRPAAELACFDGRGKEWRSRLTSSTSKQCVLELVELIREAPEPMELILAQAWLKGTALEPVVQKATELGATGIWLFNANRSNLKLDDRRLANKLRHLSRILISATEQCGSSWLPHLEVKASLEDVLANVGGLSPVVLDIGKRSFDTGTTPKPLLLIVGPEGGWSELETRLMGSDSGVSVMSLGDLVLRAETVPLAALAAVRSGWGWR